MAKRHANILIIDDSSTVCKFISNALSNLNYQATQVYDMETALDSVELINPDLVITDIMMPGIGGLAGISVLHEKWPETRIIAMSAGSSTMSSTNALAAARQLGADAVIEKPFTADALGNIVEDVLKNHPKGVKRALVIDDSKTICMMLSRELEGCGYDCKIATSMETALASEEILGLDLVITDIFMPGIGGINGIHIIRHNWPNIKIIAISGGWHSSDGGNALSAAKKIGADAVLKKPFDMEIFRATANEILGKS